MVGEFLFTIKNQNLLKLFAKIILTHIDIKKANFWIYFGVYTVCLRSSDPFYIVT